MNSFNKNPKIIYNNIKKLLIESVNDRNHTFHTPVFSNITKENKIQSRVVVLRKFDEKELKLNFHTDYRSPKIRDLLINNKSYFLFYDFKLKLQLRIETISKVNNNNKISKKAWTKTSLNSRKCYLTSKSPSSKTKIPEDGISEHLIGISPTLEESENGFINFAVVENKIVSIDWLYLKYSGHRRMKIKFKSKKPTYNWIIP
tara:strand:- start:88 stop:693 length:606 start_codon:yes stop_codon:yes gene_type:complete